MSAASTASGELSLEVPENRGPREVALAATTRLTLADRSTVGAGQASLANLGSLTTELGADTVITADVDSVGDVWLRSRAELIGNVRTSQGIRLQDDTAISGERLSDVPLLPATTTWSVDHSGAAEGPIRLEPGEWEEVTPGRFTSLRVASRATVRFRPGTYFFDRVTIEPEATLDFGDAGAITVVVQHPFILRGRLEGAALEGRLAVGVVGFGEVFAETAFSGLLVAPRAKIRLGPSPQMAHVGSFFGREVELLADASVRHAPWPGFAVCDGQCSGNGDCTGTDFPDVECLCDPGWIGPSCDTPAPLPIAACRVDYADGFSAAVFGYESELDVDVPSGSDNSLSTDERVPTTSFRSRSRNVLPMTPRRVGSSVTWTIAGRSATVDDSTRLCEPNDYYPFLPQAEAIRPVDEPSGVPLEVAEAVPEDVFGVGEGLRRAGVEVPRLVGTSRRLLSLGGEGTPPARLNAEVEQASASFLIVLDQVIPGKEGGRLNPDNDPIILLTIGDDAPIRWPAGDGNLGACDDDNSCLGVFGGDVAPTEASVPFVLQFFDDERRGPSELIFTFSGEINNLNGVISGEIVSRSGVSPVSSETGSITLAGPGGASVRVTPSVNGVVTTCATLDAFYVDSGGLFQSTSTPVPLEDYDAEGQLQTLPAAFLKYSLTLQRGDSIVRSEEGYLDENGCIPSTLAPSSAEVALGGAESPLTLAFQVETTLCYDPMHPEAPCENDAAEHGLLVRIGDNPRNDTAGATRAGTVERIYTGCTSWTERETTPEPVLDAECDDLSIATGAFPTYSNGRPSAGFTFQLGQNAFTRTAATAARVFQRDGNEDRLGVLSAATRRLDSTVVNIHPTTACFFEGRPTSCASGNDIFFNPVVPCSGGSSLLCELTATQFKYVIAHELGHVIQGAATGDIRPNYDLAGAPPLCTCDHVEGSNQGHCLQSLEPANGATMEGFAQYFASATWNDIEPGGCRFNYYKEIRAFGCLPGAAACCPGRTPAEFEQCARLNQPSVPLNPGEAVSLVPAPIDCSLPVKHRNRACAPSAGPAQAPLLQTLGTEWDWMTFLWTLDANDDVWNAASILDAVRCGCNTVPGAACADGPACTLSSEWSYQTTDDGASRLFGEESAALERFRIQAEASGVSENLEP